MTELRSLLKEAMARLAPSEDAKTDSLELMRHTLGVRAEDILISPLRELPEEKIQEFFALVEKRATGYPLQYILGQWDFYRRSFSLCEGVLIPRCETEQIVLEACNFLKGKKNLTVFDLCAGSGCIGLSVAAENPLCRVYLMDISPFALSCQRENCSRLSIDNAAILDYDIFQGFDSQRLPQPDVILCNPPYVTEEEYRELDREIFYEPKSAIVAEKNGLEFYYALSEKWIPHLAPGGFFMLECGEEQPPEVSRICALSPIGEGREIKTDCLDDLYGVCRFVKGTVS